jgi:hypothetical protein
MAVGTELFWGYDDLPFLQRFLDGDDPAAEGWAAAASLESSAMRRQTS